MNELPKPKSTATVHHDQGIWYVTCPDKWAAAQGPTYHETLGELLKSSNQFLIGDRIMLLYTAQAVKALKDGSVQHFTDLLVTEPPVQEPSVGTVVQETPAEPATPTLGRIVLYRKRYTTDLPFDDENNGETYPAIVRYVAGYGEQYNLDLTVFTHRGSLQADSVPSRQSAERYQLEECWEWPQR